MTQPTSRGGEITFSIVWATNTEAVKQWEISVRPFAPSHHALLSQGASLVTKELAHSERSAEVTPPHHSALSLIDSQTGI